MQTSYSPATARGAPSRNQSDGPFGNKPPREPDWLLIMVVVLFVITLLIAWFVLIPG